MNSSGKFQTYSSQQLTASARQSQFNTDLTVIIIHFLYPPPPLHTPPHPLIDLLDFAIVPFLSKRLCNVPLPEHRETQSPDIRL